MFNKKYLISVLVVTFCFGFLGTAIAGTISYPAGFISNLDLSTAEMDARLETTVKTEAKEVEQVRNSAPAGFISNLDLSTAEMDAKLKAMVETESKEYASCNTPAGFISNLDVSTAQMDAELGC
jgi:hypothetical protein